MTSSPRFEGYPADIDTIEQTGEPNRPHLVLVETEPEASHVLVRDTDTRPAVEHLDDWRKTEAARTNPGAFDALLKEYEGFIRFKASGYFLPDGDKQDVIQEAMIGFYKGVRDYDGQKSSLRSFLDLCISRQIITAVKTATRRKHEPLNHAVSFDAPPKGGDDGDTDSRLEDALADKSTPLDEMVVGKETFEDLLHTLASELSPLESATLRLFMEGDSYVVIAQKLDITPKAADNALQRMKRKLGRRMSKPDVPKTVKSTPKITKKLNPQRQQKRLDRLYRSWLTDGGGPSSNTVFSKILSELNGATKTHNALLGKVRGYLALVALDSDWENPLDAYRETQQAVMRRAIELSSADEKLSEIYITDALIDAALEAVKKPKTNPAS
jgi:RNA polymerase sporulation-specific sigma factor